MENKKNKKKGIFVKIIASLAVLGILATAMLPLLSLLGEKSV